jgi:putative ABC transport system substrate-binding protein
MWMSALGNAELPAGIPRVGVLNPQDAPPSMEDGLRQGLRDLGYVEGENIVIDWRRSARTPQQMRQQASELEKSDVALIVTMGTPATRAALDATGKPVVFMVGDPVATGFAGSLAKPGGNATGVSVLSTELNQKRLELLRELAPRARRIAYLTTPSNPLAAHDLAEMRKAARTLHLQLLPLNAQNADEVDAALKELRHGKADALVVTADLGLVAYKAEIARAVREARIPAMFPFKEYHDVGVLISYAPNYQGAMRRAAHYVDRILRGGKPAELPIEQTSQYEMIIDLRVAREMHIDVPEALLLRAHEVIR